MQANITRVTASDKEVYRDDDLEALPRFDGSAVGTVHRPVSIFGAPSTCRFTRDGAVAAGFQHDLWNAVQSLVV